MLRVYAAYCDILDVIRSVVGVSVCVCVDHTEVQCKNGWTNLDVVWELTYVAQGSTYWIGVEIPTRNGSFWCCTAREKAPGVSAMVYAAKWIIQSSTTARYTMRPFVKILWSLVITHAGMAAGVGRTFSRVCLFVCLFVHTLTLKRPEQWIPNLVHIYSIAVAQHALTQRSKCQRLRSHGYENGHGRTVASDHVPYSAYSYAAVLPAAVAGVGLHVDTTACVF